MKKVISILLVISLIFLFCPEKKYAYADALTITQIAGAAYAYGAAAGVDWSFTNGRSGSVAQWLENKVNSYLAGRTVTEAFGDELLRVSAGKLIIPATLAANIGVFLNDLFEEFGLDVGDTKEITRGRIQGVWIGGTMPLMSRDDAYASAADGNAAVGVNPAGAIKETRDNVSLSIYTYRTNNTPREIGLYSGPGGVKQKQIISVTLGYDANTEQYLAITKVLWASDVDYEEYGDEFTTSFNWTASVQSGLSISLDENYSLPTYPNVGYQWEGTIDGTAPDANLEEVTQYIFENAADNNLSVDGEVVEPAPAPTPIPTAVPTYPPGATELEALNTSIEQLNAQLQQNQDIIGGISSALEGINDLLEYQGSSLEAIDNLQEILSGVQNQLNGLNDIIVNSDNIVEWLDVVSDTIDQIVNDQLQPILDQIILGNGTINTSIGNVDQSIQNVGDSADSAVEELGNVVDELSDLNGLLDDLKRTVTNLYTGQGLQTDAIEGLGTDIGNASSNISTSVDSAASGVSSSVNSAASTVSNSVNSAASNVSSSVNSAASNVSSSVNSAASNVSISIDSAASSVSSSVNTATNYITQSISGVNDAVSSLEGTVSEALAVPENPEVFKFDLRELFPFSIPFDIYRLLQSFDAEPVAPHVQLPFYIESLNFRYNMDLDFSVFNPVAQVLRTCELIVYALGLAWATGKVIKW